MTSRVEGNRGILRHPKKLKIRQIHQGSTLADACMKKNESKYESGDIPNHVVVIAQDRLKGDDLRRQLDRLDHSL
eukprot:SAG31_NODE_2068_length_6521_cov_6.298194_1_plen_75_part_00